MDKKLYRELKRDNKISKIKHPNGSRFFRCPKCSNLELRGWDGHDGPAFLCYECGTVFWGCSEEVIGASKGDPHTWGAQAIATLGLMGSSKYRSALVDGKTDEFAHYLKTRQLRLGLADERQIRKLSDVDFLEVYRKCGGCGEPIYTDEQFEEAIAKHTMAEETFLFLNRMFERHALESHVDREYESLDYGEEIWRLEGHPGVLISPEVKEYVASEIAKIYVDWLFHGKTFIVDHDEDPSWDCSGRLVEVPSSALERIEAHDTLQEWWETTYTGATYATHESGCGFGHERWEEDIWDFVQDILFDVWTKKMTDEQKDALTEADDTLFEKEMEIIDLIGKMTTRQAYFEFGGEGNFH